MDMDFSLLCQFEIEVCSLVHYDEVDEEQQQYTIKEAFAYLSMMHSNILRNGNSNHFLSKIIDGIPHSRSLSISHNRMHPTLLCLSRTNNHQPFEQNKQITFRAQKKISSIRDNNNNNNNSSVNVNEKVVLCVLLHWLLQENAISNGG